MSGSDTKWLTLTEPAKKEDGQENINPKTSKVYSHTLNKNENKKNEKEPDYRGACHLVFSEEVQSIIKDNGGKLFCKIGGWGRDGANGKFISLQLQHPVESEQPVAESEQSEF
tara:strand:- start:110 stop:448 length:339 start_codon:yes stop_codon:yes gene_type:complete